MMRKILTAVIATMTLSACQNPGAYGPDSPWYRYPAGVSMILLKPLDIPPGEATVRLQFGRTVPRNGVQEQEPFCVLELTTVRPETQHVEPDTFAVTGVERSISSIAAADLPAFPLMRTGFSGDDSPTFIYFKTTFHLHSARQPQVDRMTCMANQNAAGNAGSMRHLTLAEMRQAVARYFRIDLPAQ